MTAGIVVVGCGGHGREIAGIVAAVNAAARDEPPWRLLGFVDDAPAPKNLERVQRLGAAYLGTVDELADLDAGDRFVIGIGDPAVRAEIDARTDGYAARPANLVHPDATVGPDCELSDGVVVFAGARITTNVTLGRHVHVNQNATIGHDCDLADYVSVNPLAAVSGECRLGEGVLIGTTAAVRQGLTVGPGALVAAGACVIRDVPEGAVVMGVPAR